MEIKPGCARLHRIAFDSARLAEAKMLPPEQAHGATGSGRIDVGRIYLEGAYDAPVIRMVNAAGRTDSYVNECWDAPIDQMVRAYLANYLVYRMRGDPAGSVEPRYLVEGRIIDMTADAADARVVLSATITTFRGKRDTVLWRGVVQGASSLGGGNTGYLDVPPAYERALAEIAEEIFRQIRQRDLSLRSR